MRSFFFLTSFFFITHWSNAQTQDTVCDIFNKINIQNKDTLITIMEFKYSWEKYIYQSKMNSEQEEILINKLRLTCPVYKTLSSLNNNFNSELKPIVAGDYIAWLYEDKNNGALVPWTSIQISNETEYCKIQSKESPMCECAVKNLSEVINYDRLSKLSDFQRGKATSTVAKANCK